MRPAARDATVLCRMLVNLAVSSNLQILLWLGQSLSDLPLLVQSSCGSDKPSGPSGGQRGLACCWLTDVTTDEREGRGRTRLLAHRAPRPRPILSSRAVARPRAADLGVRRITMHRSNEGTMPLGFRVRDWLIVTAVVVGVAVLVAALVFAGYLSLGGL